MAGGIDWFRWHHGSVTDPKFQLVARRAGASLPDVLAVWAYLLEQASAAKERGDIGEVDCEALDCLFGFPATETRTADILGAMRDRKLLEGNRVVAWEKRQPKREREDDGAAERQRAKRERDAKAKQATPDAANDGHVTPRHATSRQKTPRGEERREESTVTADAVTSGAAAPPPAAPEMTAAEARKREAWAGAKSLLHEHGMPKAQCGTYLGKLASDYGGDTLIEVMEAAVLERPAEPEAWMRAACQRRAGQRAPPQSRRDTLQERRISVMKALTTPQPDDHDDRTFDAETRIVG